MDNIDFKHRWIILYQKERGFEWRSTFIINRNPRDTIRVLGFFKLNIKTGIESWYDCSSKQWYKLYYSLDRDYCYSIINLKIGEFYEPTGITRISEDELFLELI